MRKLAKRVAKAKGTRFVVAGAGNTLFGLVDTLGCTWLFVHLNPSHAALMTSVATVVSTVLNITVSFLSYKFFVFQTRGNYLGEYGRSLLVYLPSMVVSTVAVAPLAALLQRWLTHPEWAPYGAQMCIVAVAIVPQFLGHKKITFRQRVDPIEAVANTDD